MTSGLTLTPKTFNLRSTARPVCKRQQRRRCI
jgi:hypothetical protein